MVLKRRSPVTVTAFNLLTYRSITLYYTLLLGTLSVAIGCIGRYYAQFARNDFILRNVVKIDGSLSYRITDYLPVPLARLRRIGSFSLSLSTRMQKNCAQSRNVIFDDAVTFYAPERSPAGRAYSPLFCSREGRRGEYIKGEEKRKKNTKWNIIR